MSPIDWKRVAADFAQKYEGTFCRYVSPITAEQSVFKIVEVVPRSDSGPDLVLNNSQVGDIALKWYTEAELDFSFPPMGYVPCNRFAYCLMRRYERQFRKGLSDATAYAFYPYTIATSLMRGETITEALVTAAFKMNGQRTPFWQAMEHLQSNWISYPLSPQMALGLGATKGQYWLWFERLAIATLDANRNIQMLVESYTQEVRDALVSTNESERYTICSTNS